MRLRNCRGTPVDPVPFIVVTGLAFMLLLSFGPLYGQALGVPIGIGVAVSGGLSLAVAAVAYYRQVWTAYPETVTVPASVRGERLFYLVGILTALIAALAVPLLI